MQEDQRAKGIMILIEFKDTVGLQNFTNEMEKRNINGLLDEEKVQIIKKGPCK